MFEENNVLFLFSGTSEFLGFDYGFYCSSSLNATLTSAESILQPFSLTFSFLLEDVYLSVLYLTTTPSPSSPPTLLGSLVNLSKRLSSDKAALTKGYLALL